MFVHGGFRFHVTNDMLMLKDTLTCFLSTLVIFSNDRALYADSVFFFCEGCGIIDKVLTIKVNDLRIFHPTMSTKFRYQGVFSLFFC